jgi:hypothetical protein
MTYPVEVPDWLLGRLFLNRGVFNEERTAVISGSQEEPTDSFSVDLTERSDWEQIKERLANEGLLTAAIEAKRASQAD